MRRHWFLELACLTAIGLALGLAPALGAGAAAYEGERWAPLDTAAVLRAAGQITTNNFPDSDEAIVEAKLVRVYRPDGTGECQDETFTKVLTEKGKRGNRSLSLYYMLPYSTAEAIKLEVLKPGGQVVAVDIAANSKEMIDDSQMGMNIYDPNSKIVRVNIAQVEIGDVIHSITRTTLQRSIIPGEYAEDNLFESSGFIRHMTYEVYSPAEKPLKRIMLRDEVPGTVAYQTEPLPDHGTRHRWEVTNVPRMFEEPGMPSYEVVLQRLLISTLPDWQAVSKWYYTVCLPHLEAMTPDMITAVNELTAGATDDQEKIKAVFYHVAKKIRYMGLTPEKDRPGYEPHDVKLTFANKYGVCRDKAALLVALLRTAGFNAYPVLVNVGSKKDAEVPSPFFNHAIVGVELKPGNHILMDPTAENTKDLLPSYECDQSYLLCRPEGDTIRTSPIIPAEENMMRIKTTGTLTAAGTLEAHSELWFEGINDNEYREAFSRMKPDDKRRFFERSLKRTMPGARLKSFKLMPEDMLDTSSGLRGELDFSVDGMTATGNGKAVLSLPWVGNGMGAVNFVLGGTGLEKRKYPLRTQIACGRREEIILKLGEGFTGAISMPHYSPIADEGFSYQRKVDLKEGQLICFGELKLKTVQFSPQQYQGLKASLKALDFDERKEPVLAISGTIAASTAPAAANAEGTVESNARILDSRKELAVHDAHGAILKGKYVKQVLSYSGKKTEAEVKIGFNPACEEVQVTRAVVTSKDGRRQEISTNEINVMDASWNASAKRYTGGRMLVANLPGVDLGSTIEVEYQIASHDKPFVSGFETFQTFDDLDHKDFQLVAPAGVPIRRILTGKSALVKEQSKSTADRQAFEWEADHVKALPAETQLPPEWVYMAGVDYFAGDLNAYLAELRTVMLDRSGKRTKAAELARQLAKGSSSPREAVLAIRDHVAKSIRLAGPSFAELPLRELSAADTTLADGYGHLADRAILLHAMLSAAGFQPEFVLGSGLPPIAGITNVTDAVPLPQNFQSPLVKVAIDGQNYYLNDTDQYSRLGSTGFDGRLGIVLATQNFEVIRAAQDCRDKTETTYTLSLADSGKTRVGISRRYFGGTYDGKKRYFSELPPEERKRYYQEVISGVAQGARPVGELTTAFDTYPGVEEFTVEVDHYNVVDGNYSYFDLPFTPSLFPMGADRRSLPLYISRQSAQTVRTEIDLPPGFARVALAPGNANLSAPQGAGRARITSAAEGGKRVITHEFETSPAIISPEEYPALLALESTLGRKASKVFLLEASEHAPPLP